MIDTQVRIHDKFSVEFKIGFTTSPEDEHLNRYNINTWMFVPNGLDVNRYTYTKNHFYSDIKTNVRLITPIYTLKEILTEGRGPFPRLEKSLCNYVGERTEQYAEHSTYQIKMLLCIVKSALRKNCFLIKMKKTDEELHKNIREFIWDVSSIISNFRRIRNDVLKDPAISTELKEHMLFGDEYLSSITEDCVYDLLRYYKRKAVYEKVKPLLLDFLQREEANRNSMGYTSPSEKDKEHNSLFLIKKSLLKKFVESDLYLQRIKKADGMFICEFYYSIAAGLAMIFATVISFVATQRFGNFTMALFFALVIGYMFKDRIKETARYYFSSKLDQKYFDWKWNVSIRNRKIGWIKEAFDFISEDKLPYYIRSLRNKSPLVKAENKVYDEQVILYRKRVGLSKKDLEEYKEYHLSGINDIIRLNLTSFLKKMDNPTVPLYIPDNENGYKVIEGKRVYAIYFLLECSSKNETYYKKYRLLINRNGISDVTEIND